MFQFGWKQNLMIPYSACKTFEIMQFSVQIW